MRAVCVGEGGFEGGGRDGLGGGGQLMALNPSNRQGDMGSFRPLRYEI